MIPCIHEQSLHTCSSSVQLYLAWNYSLFIITGIMTLYCTATSEVPDEEEIDDGKLISSSAYVHLISVYCTSFRNRCC